MEDTQDCTEYRLVLPSDAEYREPKLLLKYHLFDDNSIQSLAHLNVCFLDEKRRLYCLDSKKPRHIIALKDSDHIDTLEMSNFLRYLLYSRNRLLVGDNNVDLWWLVECFLSNTLIPEDEPICLLKSVVLNAYKQDQKNYPHLRLHGKLYSAGKMTQFLKAHLPNINIFKHDSRSHLTHRTPHYRFASLNDLRHYVATYILKDPSYYDFFENKIK